METIKKFKPIECPNCGAPLRSNYCEYCGSYIDIGTNLNIEFEYWALKKRLEYERCKIAQESQINQIFSATLNSLVPMTDSHPTIDCNRSYIFV